MTIKDILDNKINSTQKAQLMYAFEHDLSQYVVFSSDQYVGVNTEYIKNLHPDQIAGRWSVGKIVS